MAFYLAALLMSVFSVVMSKEKSQELNWLFTQSGNDMDTILKYTLRD